LQDLHIRSGHRREGQLDAHFRRRLSGLRLYQAEAPKLFAKSD
jgi:hypothetical protein